MACLNVIGGIRNVITEEGEACTERKVKNNEQVNKGILVKLNYTYTYTYTYTQRNKRKYVEGLWPMEG